MSDAEKIAKMREALEQVLVDINDPDPLKTTAEGWAECMEATAEMVRAVLKRTK